MITAPARGFETAEFAERSARAQRLMQAQNIDLLWFSTEPELRYFCGFHSQFWQSPTRPWFMLLPRRGKPIAIIPSIGHSAMARTWVEDIRCWSSPHPTDDGMALLLSVIRDHCPSGGRVGTLMARETLVRMPLHDLDRLRADMGTRALVDATEIVHRVREIKSTQEIAKIRHICQLTSGVFERLPAFVSLGDSEQAIFKRFKIEMLEAGADDVSYLVGGAAPGGYDDIISPPSDKPTREGDVLMLDTGGVYDGYFCDFDRNYAFGSPSAEAAKAHAVIWKATEAGFAAIRPGVTMASVFHAMQTVLEAGGAQGNNVGRMGHGLGIQLTEWPSFAAFDQTPIREGMVLTLEPGMMYAPGKMLVHEENLVVRADGAEWLSRRAPSEMPVIK